MTPKKPVLQPLKTPKTTILPSEAQCPSTLASQLDTKTDKSKSRPITPPLAYTQFLKALTPAFRSPVSPAASFSRYPIEKLRTPSTATSLSFPHGGESVKPESGPPELPVTTPVSAKSANGRKRLRVSTARAPRKVMSPPATDSPRSASTVAYSPFSPTEWRMHYFDGPGNPPGKAITVREVVTTTVTYRQIPLEPRPKGKRGRTSVSPQA